MVIWLDTALEKQRPSFFLWVPVFLGIGVGGYFSLASEPVLPLAILLPVLLTLFALARLSRITLLRAVLLVCLFLLAGLTLAATRAKMVAAPVLHDGFAGAIEGRVSKIDRSSTDKLRMVLDQVTLYGVARDQVPQKVRVTVIEKTLGFRPGERVLVQGRLSAPGAPVEPGGFDFRRMAWFQQLGGIGYATGPVLRAGVAGDITLWHRIMALRVDAANAIRAHIPGPNGGFAAAILTGDRSAIDPVLLEHLRSSNLAHLLAISGLHMGLLTGFVFALVRIALVLVPKLALRAPIKKLAACAAILAGGTYLIASGASVATQRAFVMVAVVFVAVLLDRPALTLRAVALAALIVLLIRPESLVEAGFQMSFAATIALIATFNALRQLEWWRRPVTGWSRVIRWAAALLVSSSVAGAATAPFSAFHFNQIAQYGLLANLTAVPVMGFLVMPAAVVAILLWPVGLSWVGWWIMGKGIGLILWIAGFVAGLDGAVTRIPMAQSAVLPLLSIGALIVILWIGRARFVGLPVMICALLLWIATDRPQILIDGSGRLLGVKTTDGRAMNRPRGAGFAAARWLENDGDAASQIAAAKRPGIVTKAGVSRVDHGALNLAYMGKKATDRPDDLCRVVDILVLEKAGSRPRNPRCTIIDQASLKQSGAVAIFETDTGFSIISANAIAGRRPWTRR